MLPSQFPPSFAMPSKPPPKVMNHDKRLWKCVTFLLVAIAGFGSPALVQSVSLSTTSLGFGNAVVGTTSARKAVVTLSPTSLSFSAQPVGTTSAAQTVTLTNNERTTLTISGIVVSGDFAQTNTCGSSVGAVATCTISVTFRPTAIGSETGTLTVIDNASDSPQEVSL